MRLVRGFVAPYVGVLLGLGVAPGCGSDPATSGTDGAGSDTGGAGADASGGADPSGGTDSSGGAAGAGGDEPLYVGVGEPMFESCFVGEFLCNGRCVSRDSRETEGCTVLHDALVVKDLLLDGERAFAATSSIVYEITPDGELDTIIAEDVGNLGTAEVAVAGDRVFFLLETTNAHSLFGATDVNTPELLDDAAPGGRGFLGGGHFLFLHDLGDAAVTAYDVLTSEKSTPFELVSSMAVGEEGFYFTQGEDDSVVLFWAPLTDLGSIDELGPVPGTIQYVREDSFVTEKEDALVAFPKTGGPGETLPTSATSGADFAPLGELMGYIIENPTPTSLGHEALYTDLPGQDAPLLLAYWEPAANVTHFEANDTFAYVASGGRLLRLRLR